MESPHRSDPSVDPHVPDEQRLYARWMDRLVKVGLLGMLGAGIVYLSGMLAPRVPIDTAIAAARLPTAEYLAATGMPSRPWAWLSGLAHGDVLVYAPVVFLALITIACYLRLLPIYLRKGDRIFAAIVVCEVLILGLAASGLCNVGH